MAMAKKSHGDTIISDFRRSYANNIRPNNKPLVVSDELLGRRHGPMQFWTSLNSDVEQKGSNLALKETDAVTSWDRTGRSGACGRLKTTPNSRACLVKLRLIT